MTKKIFDSIILLRFGQTKVAIKEFYGSKNNNNKNWGSWQYSYFKIN